MFLMIIKLSLRLLRQRRGEQKQHTNSS